MRHRRRLILRFWHEYTREHGLPPSIREAQEACGISTPSLVVYHLNALVKSGDLTHVRGKSRAYRLVEINQ